MLTLSTGKIIWATIDDAFREKWSALDNDEFLYRYLLAHTCLKAYDDGLPDEEHKVLKHYGIKYWEPGMEEVKFNNTNYKVLSHPSPSPNRKGWKIG